MEKYDRVIIGGGFYGLYSAVYCGKRKEKILVLERESRSFKRATYVNQARVHMGYHYPRSISTAKKSAGYFERFCRDFEFCIYKEFKQIYAISRNLSWTNADDFMLFCENANVPCERVDCGKYFNQGMCDGAFLTTEYTYDAMLLRNYLLSEIDKLSSVKVIYGHYPEKIVHSGFLWKIEAQDLNVVSPFILNTSYASVNEVLKCIDGGVFRPFKIKYEKCEIILCDVNEKLRDVGITVMDGPFFSIMPFGKTKLHSLTSVTFTPHETSYDETATFKCQETVKGCGPGSLLNCNDCYAKPASSWRYMSQLVRKYLKDEFCFQYHDSLYSIKPILQASEVDDSRPTVIKRHCMNPTIVSVLSGKINTVYDLDEVLLNG